MVVWSGEREREKERDGERAIDDYYNVPEKHCKILAKIFGEGESNQLFFIIPPPQIFSQFSQFCYLRSLFRIKDCSIVILDL
jgi:hypothetical protein